MKEQLLNAWHIHERMNLLLIDTITDEGMQKTLSSRGGRTVYFQLVHIHNVRLSWLEIIDESISSKYEKLDKETAYDRKILKKALEDSSKGIEELINKSWDAGGKLKGFKTGLIPFIAYLISHESHHRGNILLTLKQSGIKLPDTLKWGLWEWGK